MARVVGAATLVRGAVYDGASEAVNFDVRTYDGNERACVESLIDPGYCDCYVDMLDDFEIDYSDDDDLAEAA